LIEIPYWWDRKYESLAATIYSQRPDLFSEKIMGKPIPGNEPTSVKTVKSKNKMFLRIF
jgi:hypothetical protein